MKQFKMKKINFLASLLFGLSLLTATSVKANFEGVFEFTKKTGATEVSYKYFVKPDKVRIEDYGTDGTLQGVMLVDLKTAKVIGLSPDRKLWMDMPNNRKRKEPNIKVEKTGKSKDIAGFSCVEWKVTCAEEDRIITYWMAKDNFNFFLPMLKALNRADKLSLYFLKLSGIDGMFPMMGEEKKSDGTLITTLKVASVKKQELQATLFEVPKDYAKYDK